MSEREVAREVSGRRWVFRVTGVLWFVIACVDEFMTMAVQQGWKWVHAEQQYYPARAA